MKSVSKESDIVNFRRLALTVEHYLLKVILNHFTKQKIKLSTNVNVDLQLIEELIIYLVLLIKKIYYELARMEGMPLLERVE